ncbi:zinc-ribbon domain-containing protein [Archangium sp.]|uniref:zinc-ribbon domain-containing protein n=1 Tax=Archangium sp. TaxID=1872627 RepID=UPI00389ACD5F
MEIACPQCSMQYALDPQFVPSGGVPVQCTRCRHVFIAAPEAPSASPRPAPKPSLPPNPNLKATMPYGGPGKTGPQPGLGATQAFGVPVPQVPSIAPMAPVAKPAAKAPAGTPAPHTTQVFGAVTQGPPAVPPVAPVAPRPQPAPAGTPPSAHTTQVFGAVPVPKPPAGPRPPPAAKPPAGTPAPQTTQVFGAVTQPPQPARPPAATGTPPVGSPAAKQAAPGARPPAATPAPQTTQVFGAVPQPSLSPTQLFGEAPLAQTGAPQGTPPAKPATGPAPAQPPGMTPRATTLPEPLLVGLAPSSPSEPMMGVAATTPIELPDEVLDQLNRPLAELMAEESSSEDRPPSPGPSGPGLTKPLELPTELLDGSIDVNNKSGRDRRPEPGRKGRGLFIAGGVLVLALTAFLTSPAWLSKSDALSHDARVTRDEAVALLRRDDAGSKEEALSRLRSLSTAHPQSVELLVELGVALAMHLDDTQARVRTLQARMEALQSRITRLTQAKAPADWLSRVNTMREELNALRTQLTPLEERAKALSKDAVQVMKQLESAPEKESKEAALARLRGRALLNAVLGGDALNMVVQLAQAGQGDWSTLTMAEYVLHYATPEAPHITQAVTGLEGMRETDKAYLRPYVLGARIALMRKEPPAQAQSLLDTVITLNPKHELARLLHAYAQELADQADEPKELPQAPTPGPVEPTPEAPAPEGGDASPAPAPSESTATTAPAP